MWKNNYHIEMDRGLINDPNGLNYFKGEYYIFYQWNPVSCTHKNKHWGFVKTKDFINFSYPRIVLEPRDFYDKDGCYSGSSIVKDDELYIFYTGNVRDKDKNRIPYQCRGRFYNNKIIKDGFIIENSEEGYTDHFRDPMIFKHKEGYYMILGAQRKDLTGCAVMYYTEDLKEFRFLGELNTKLKDFGYMWECPNIFKVSKDKYAFLFCPQGVKSEEFKYQNKHNSGYIIGGFDEKTLSILDHSEFRELDMGFDFYAPQVFLKDNKIIMLSWVGLPDHKTLTKDYMFSLSLPRNIYLRNNKLYSSVIPEIKGLRSYKIKSLQGFKGSSYTLTLNKRSIEIKLLLKHNGFINIRFLFRNEEIFITYDGAIITLSRENMILGDKGVRRFYLNIEDTLSLHIFIDKSIMEIFYNDGEEVTTFNYYPKYNDLSLVIEGNENFTIDKLNIWALRGIKYEE